MAGSSMFWLHGFGGVLVKRKAAWPARLCGADEDIPDQTGAAQDSAAQDSAAQDEDTKANKNEVDSEENDIGEGGSLYMTLQQLCVPRTRFYLW